MITRILSVCLGAAVILFVLFFRGLPVLALLKVFPLIALLLIGIAFILAGVMSDSD
jgi:hypothetical protein